MRVGSGDHTYEVVEDWLKLPDDWSLGWIGSIVTDRSGRVYCFNRGKHPLTVFDREGNVVDHWGDDLLCYAHGVFMDHSERLWLTDQHAHVVWVCNTVGELQWRLGYPHVTSVDGGLFNQPTNAHVSPDGSIYVSDGYGDTKCHRFAADGTLQVSWGEPGDGPGQFARPHAIWALSDDRVLVADRENNRVEIFDPDGEYITEWPDIPLPTDFYVDEDAGVIYLTELHRGIMLLDLDGKLITRWGEHGQGPGQYWGPHGIWVDDHGAIYMAEVVRDSHLHKFVPVR